MFIAVDESETESYLIIGTVWFPNERVPEFERQVSEFRLRNHFWREFHLSELSASSDGFAERNYLEFLRIGIANGAEFKCIAVRRDSVNMNLHDNNPRIMQLNFLCVLVRNKLRTEYPDSTEEITVLADNYIDSNTEVTRTQLVSTQGEGGDGSTYTLSEVRKRAIPHAKERAERHLERRIECFAQCSSHLSSVIQLADLFVGAVSARARGITESDSRWQIVNEFETTFGQRLNQGSLPDKKDLNIWIWRPPRF